LSIEIGLTGRNETVVCQENTAAAVGSGMVPVFATPFMIALMEGAAANSLLPELLRQALRIFQNPRGSQPAIPAAQQLLLRVTGCIFS